MSPPLPAGKIHPESWLAGSPLAAQINSETWSRFSLPASEGGGPPPAAKIQPEP